MRLTTPDGKEYALSDAYIEVYDNVAYCQSTTTDIDDRLLRLGVVSGCKLDDSGRQWSDVRFAVDGFSASAQGKIVADVSLKWPLTPDEK
jgi:hypothetical protein